jgi:hypothetical protein
MQRVRDLLRRKTRRTHGRGTEPTAAVVDAQSVQARWPAAFATATNPRYRLIRTALGDRLHEPHAGGPGIPSVATTLNTESGGSARFFT